MYSQFYLDLHFFRSSSTRTSFGLETTASIRSGSTKTDLCSTSTTLNGEPIFSVTNYSVNYFQSIKVIFLSGLIIKPSRSVTKANRETRPSCDLHSRTCHPPSLSSPRSTCGTTAASVRESSSSFCVFINTWKARVFFFSVR